MVLLVSPKVRGRGLFSILRSFLSRRRQFHDPQPSSAEQPQHEIEAMNFPIPEKHVAPRRDTPCTNFDDTDSIVNQLAVLAATIRAPREDTRSSSSSAKTTQSEARLEARLEKEQEIGDSFLYLRSLITVSQTPEPKPNSKTNSKPEREQEQERVSEPETDSKSDSHPPLRRKRASSRLSLRLEIPPLQFTPKVLCKPKPSPRYTTVPPIYSPKPISIRPEVRF
ncbi:hypothetical protein N7456_008008 [Penicillium angulare]|uniref:Uncharacterized protein n=1 Tax=Penicillium angulare TaxID=116970 RepID=A0A9W9FBT5_9EURO|nr:hypothetical protein N7456_008008 [Penicillium angulare]